MTRTDEKPITEADLRRLQDLGNFNLKQIGREDLHWIITLGALRLAHRKD